MSNATLGNGPSHLLATDQIDHTNYPIRISKMDSVQLRAIISDCQHAMRAMPDNPKNGYYADEINYCASEMYKRAMRDTKNNIKPLSV